MESKRNTRQYELTKFGLLIYVNRELVPLLSDPKLRLNGTTKVWVRTADTSSAILSEARIQFWKRIIAFKVLTSPAGAKGIFGPYFDISPLGKNLPLDQSAGHPKRSYAAGYLVGMIIGDSLALVPDVAKAQWYAFSQRGNVITNTSDKAIWVRLVINDSIPDDNGPGFANVAYTIEPIAEH